MCPYTQKYMFWLLFRALKHYRWFSFFSISIFTPYVSTFFIAPSFPSLARLLQIDYSVFDGIIFYFNFTEAFFGLQEVNNTIVVCCPQIMTPKNSLDPNKHFILLFFSPLCVLVLLFLLYFCLFFGFIVGAVFVEESCKHVQIIKLINFNMALTREVRELIGDNVGENGLKVEEEGRERML